MDCIVNADDFGLSESVNRAICEGFSRGVIQRTTLLVNMPYTEQAVELARENGFEGCVGLHINLVEGRPLTQECRDNRVLCDENGEFTGTFHYSIKKRFILDKATTEAIAKETEAQIRRFIELGLPLRHADSHRYIHTYYSAAKVIIPLLVKYGFDSVRISRNMTGSDSSLPFRIYKKLFNGYLVKHGLAASDLFGSTDDYMRFIEKNPILDGDVELMTHPDIAEGEFVDLTDGKTVPFLTKVQASHEHLQLTPVGDKRASMLVLIHHDHIGGAATSLANFLVSIDYTRFKVDLLYNEDYGRSPLIPDEVVVLPQARKHRSGNIANVLGKVFNPAYVIAFIRAQYSKKVKHNNVHAVQIMSAQGCRYSKRIRKHYDVAVSYDLTWSSFYMMKYVDADKKYIWHHDDYEAIGYKIREDRRCFDKCDGLVFVSTQCRDKFAGLYPEYAQKCFYMPNITAAAPLKIRAREKVELPFERKDGVVYFITVARVVFRHKGMDRVIRAFSRLRDDGLLDRFHWTIVGDGEDFGALVSLISENHLEDHVCLLGVKTNPIPYLQLFDAFLLPSHYEGKPMAITEGQIMGIVPIVTRYTSAGEQIENGVDGLIFDNDDEAIYQGLHKLALDPDVLTPMREKVKERTYSNEKDIEYFYRILNQTGFDRF